MSILQTGNNSVYKNSYFCRKAAIINMQNCVIIETKYHQFLIPQRIEENQMCRLGKPFLQQIIEICTSQITVHTPANLVGREVNEWPLHACL